MNCTFQFALEFSGPDGQALGQHPITPDWLPAGESLRFDVLRRGSDLPVRSGDIHVTPQWSEHGAPFVSSLLVTTGGAPGVTIPVNYLRPEARKIEKLLVEQEKLKKGDTYTFKTLAYARTEAPPPKTRDIFNICEEEVDSPVSEREIQTLIARSTTDSEEGDEGAALRVFIPQRILDETRDVAEAAGNLETGGILIGHVHRDPVKSVIFIEVTAQIQAAHTTATGTSLSFNDDTWMAARAAIAIRNDGSRPVGWQHNHPSRFFCNEACPMEKRLVCAMQQPFLSADDLLLHRTVFSKGWQIALLVNVADAGTTHTVWGWHEGSVRQIPFRVLHETQKNTAAVEPPEIEAVAA